jgi:hypothetical protein
VGVKQRDLPCVCVVRLMTWTKEHMESDRVWARVFTSCPGDHLIHQLIHERRPAATQLRDPSSNS